MERERSSFLSDGVFDSTPLLASLDSSQGDGRSLRHSRRPSLSGAARLLRRVSNRHLMREPSMLVRERAAEQLEERQSDWAYSRPIVFLDVAWNLAFIVAAVGFILVSLDEMPSAPLRFWLAGYALQCLLHIVCVCVEYSRRYRTQRLPSLSRGHSRSVGVSENVRPLMQEAGEHFNEEGSMSAMKNLESVNAMFSFIWWIVGFYWVSAGGQTLMRDAPQLYWISTVFLAFDVFFVVFCIALACIVGIAVCCCLPCIIAILYAVANQEGASDEDIRQLVKYRFQKSNRQGRVVHELEGAFGGIMTECETERPIEKVLSVEDAECCIGLSAYDDGVELRELPCDHHFHCICIDKWLYLNATCPLCKCKLQNHKEP